MKKKTLVSILAMTSASMAAYADANLDQIKADAATDWTGAADLDFENGVFTSPSGLTISQNIGKLVKGKYTLTVSENENAKITVNGNELVNNQFEITAAEADVIIRIETATSGSFKVGGFKLVLDHEFALDQKGLVDALAKVTAKLETLEDAQADELVLRASQLSAKIAAIKDDGEDEYKAYALYKDYELYKGWANSTIMADISALDEEVNKYVGNATPYYVSKEIGDARQTALDNAKAAIENIADEDARKYAGTVTAEAYNTIKGKIDTFLKTALDAYNAGNAVEVCTQEFNDEFAEEVDKLIADYSAAIAAAPGDHVAYTAVAEKISELKDLYNKTLQDVYAAFDPGDKYPDVYGPVLEEAQAKLNEQYVDILEVEKKNGNETNHVGAAANQATNDAALTEAKTKIGELGEEYKQKAQALKLGYDNAQSMLDDLQDRLDEIAGFEGVKDNYGAAVDAIQKLIDDLTAKVEADTKNNTIDTADYTADKAAVEEKIGELVEEAVGGQENYDAYTGLKESVSVIQKTLNETNIRVNALKSKDGKYAVDGKYAANEAKLQEEIDGYTSAISEAFKNETCVAWKAENESKFAETTQKIADYEAKAKEGVAAYEVVVTALADYDEAIKKLEKKVGSEGREVPVYNGEDRTDVTYGDRIDAMRLVYNKINNKKNSAVNEKTGDEHYKLLVEAQTLTTTEGATIVTDAGMLVGTFDADKAKYDEDVVEIAVERLFNQAKKSVETQEARLKDWDDDYKNKLGKSEATLQAEKDRLSAALQAQKDLIPDVLEEGKEAENMALLASINAELNTIGADITDLLNEAEEVAKKVKANTEAKTNADKVVQGIKDQLNGNGTTVPKGVLALNEDANRTAEFTDLVDGITTKLNEQVKAINDSTEKEVLVAAWPGIKVKLDAISTEVANARTAAEASTTNWKAYDAIMNATTGKIATLKIGDNIDKARTDVAAATDGTNETYYLGEIEKYETQFDEITADVEKAYTERKSADQQKDFETQFENLNTNINGLKAKAEADKKAYYEQIGKDWSKRVTQEWEDAYYKISTGDQTSIVQDYLKQLTEEQTKLNKLKQSIESYYANGQSAAKDGEVKEELSSISNTISNILQAQEDGYDEAIAADNTARIDRFNEAVKDARDAFSAALDTISDFSNLKNTNFNSMVAEAVNEANTAINGYLAEVRELETTANAAYQNTPAGELFDEDEQYKQQVEDIIGDISTALKVMNDKVNAEAKPYFKGEYEAHELLLEAAKEELLNAGYTEDVRKTAFDDVDKILKAAKADLDADVFLPLKVDAHLEKFETIEGLIAADKEKAAGNEWKAEIGRVDNKIDTTLTKLNAWEYADDADQAKKKAYINEYKASEKAYIIPAKEDYAKAVAEGKALYGEVINGLKAKINSFDAAADDIYTRARKDWEDKEASNKAYDRIVGKVDDVKAELTAAAEFVDNYVITELYEDLVSAENSIEALLEDATEWRVAGSCVRNETLAESRCNTITATLKSLYARANGYEQSRILKEFDVLRGEQNKAAAAVVGKPEEEEVDAYIAKIDDLVVKFEKAIDSKGEIGKLDDEKAKQAKYLVYEDAIADMRTELAAYYNSDLSNTLYTELMAKVGEVETNWKAETETLNGMHANVQAEFKSSMAAVGTSIEGIKADIDSYNGEGRILFYNDKLTFGINAIAEELATIAAEAAEAQKPYTANEEAYVRLTGEIQSLETKLNAMVEKLTAYRFYDIETETAQAELKVIQDLIDKDAKTVEDTYAIWKLTANSTLAHKQTVESKIAAMDKSATIEELDASIHSEDAANIGLIGLWLNVDNVINGTDPENLYIPEDKELLNKTLDEIEESIKALCTYHNDAQSGRIFKDIDGKDLVGDDGQVVASKAIDYMTEAVPAVQKKITLLTEKMATLATDAEDKAYILGDVDRDGSVLVNDYTQIMNYVLGVDQVEEGSMVFYAADINKDGKINIGDVTAVASIIRGEMRYTNYAVRNVRARVAVDRTVESTDVVEMTMSEESSVKRIAIRLKNTTAYTGCQLDVKLPVGVTLLNESLGERASDHELYSNTMDNGTHRIVVSSLRNSELSDVDDVLVYLEVSGKAASKITVSNVLAADASGSVYSIGGSGEGGVTGINGVQANPSMKEKIYSVGGQIMDKFTRGINIIRNSDGSVKKVLKK